MPTKPEPPAPQLTDLLAPEQEEHTQLAKALAEAQEEIASLKDRQREERLGFIVLIVIVVDCAILLKAENAGGPIVIGLLQFAALSVLAARMGVEEFAALFKNVFDRMADALPKRDG